MQNCRLGIDLGSTTAKAVLIDSTEAILASALTIENTPPQKACETLLRQLGLEEFPERLCATGYGRSQTGLECKKVTEITCHARGVYALHPQAKTIIDIGGQDSKAILLDNDGSVADFAMNDKCAAGTGSFLDAICRRFNIGLEDLQQLDLQHATPLPISSTCVVFAESEVVNLLSQGNPVEDILAGIHAAIARRVSRLYSQITGTGPIFFSGGVAKNPAMRQALSTELQTEIICADQPQLMGAYGAALLA